jgi:4-amino-4-deoxy-L-arabinose transferase-like glycosyltransferase
MSPGARSWLGLGALWLALALLALLTRPLFPMDETRYVAVAWEMWQRGDFLVPYLNGAPYSHKPPLFFWLVHAGWWLFGVNEWWPRSVAPLASLGALFVTARLARRLWPQDAATARLVSWVLFGSIFWTAFYSWVQIDMLLVLFSVMAMLGIVTAAQGSWLGWFLTGVSLGLGVLSKGPVILLPVVPVALLAALWMDTRPRRSWCAWYGGLGVSLLIGSLIVLAWVLPAAQAGGVAYREAILWGQTADRLVQSFAHAHPWWWYLPWLPVLAAPWVLLPWLWRRFPVDGSRRDPGWRFCVVWLIPSLVLLSLISGKQVKYLLPLMPAFALLVARAISRPMGPVGRRRPVLLVSVLLVAGALVAALPWFPGRAGWMGAIHPLWGGLIMAAGVGVLLLGPLRERDYPVVLSLLSVYVIGVVHLGVFRAGAHAYDMREVSGLIARAQAAGHAVANLAVYHGQFHFHGRLKRPLEMVLTPEEAVAWGRDHPDGYLVAYYRADRPDHPGAVYAQAFRSGSLAVWRGTTVAIEPGLLP